MSRRHSDRALEAKGDSRQAILEALLDQLCVRFGFCLPPDAKAVLRSSPPEGVDAFLEAVISAEGVVPEALDSSLRRGMREVVDQEAGRIL
jgi:hypothetical protein